MPPISLRYASHAFSCSFNSLPALGEASFVIGELNWLNRGKIPPCEWNCRICRGDTA